MGMWVYNFFLIYKLLQISETTGHILLLYEVYSAWIAGWCFVTTDITASNSMSTVF